jgi:hypothetical protein
MSITIKSTVNGPIDITVLGRQDHLASFWHRLEGIGNQVEYGEAFANEMYTADGMNGEG